MPTSLAAMLALINDNTSGDISAADHRATIQALYDWIPLTEKYKMGRLAGETAHGDDDFFTTLTGYTDTDVTGTSTWSATRGGLSCVFAGQSSGDISILVKPIPVAGVPITIETRMTTLLQEADNPLAGILFTDGTTSAANIAGFGVVGHAAGHILNYQFSGTVTSISTTALTGAAAQARYTIPQPPFMRWTWAAANTFGWSLSYDTENWTDFGRADLSTTFTPTHMGFFVSAFTANSTNMALFNFLRVYEADLSV